MCHDSIRRAPGLRPLALGFLAHSYLPGLLKNGPQGTGMLLANLFPVQNT